MIRKTLTTLFADVQGYTSRTGRQTREQHEQFIIKLQSFIKKQAEEKNGNFIKSMGDGFMLTFESPTDAVACGINIQKQISLKNTAALRWEKPILFRIGISTGEVMVDDSGDVYGDAVNIAARIEKFAIPGEVYISEATFLAMNKAEFNAYDLGPQKFKNVRHEINVYRAFEGTADVITSLRQPISKKHIQAVTGIILIIVIGLLLAYLSQRKSSELATKPEVDIHAQFKRMMSNRDFHGIIETAEKMLQDDPNRGELYAFIGEAFMQLGDLQRAEPYLTKAIGLDPENPGAYYMLSNLCASKKEFNQAINYLAEYLRREQNAIEKQIAIDKMQELENLKAEAFRQHSNKRTLVQNIPESIHQPDSPQSQPQQPSAIEAANYSTEKEDIELEQDKEYQPKNLSIHGKRREDNLEKLQELRKQVKEYMLDDDYETARDILGTAEKDHFDNFGFLIFASKLYLKMDAYAKAEDILMRAIDLNPDNPTPYFGLSLVYEEMEDYQESIKMLEEFIYRDKNEIRRNKTESKIRLLRSKMEEAE